MDAVFRDSGMVAAMQIGIVKSSLQPLDGEDGTEMGSAFCNGNFFLTQRRFQPNFPPPPWCQMCRKGHMKRRGREKNGAGKVPGIAFRDGYRAGEDLKDRPHHSKACFLRRTLKIQQDTFTAQPPDR